MSLYEDYVLPRLIDVALGGAFNPIRARVAAPMEGVVLEDASVDHALITWSLCTIPDASRALAEVHRVLVPGGRLHFVEHGLSPNPGPARWQRRLTPLWGRLAGGCHLDRPIDHLVSSAGFDLARLDRYRFSWPEPFAYLYEGVADKPR